MKLRKHLLIGMLTAALALFGVACNGAVDDADPGLDDPGFDDPLDDGFDDMEEPGDDTTS